MILVDGCLSLGVNVATVPVRLMYTAPRHDCVLAMMS
jgi:hypothetical protein